MSRFQLLATSLCMLLAFCFGGSAVEAAELDVSLGTGYLSGYTRYQIGGHVAVADGSSEDFHFPISELKFPLDSVMGQLAVGIRLDEKLTLKLKGQTNITADTGSMEDSDWLFSVTQLDIFSESDTEMRAWLGEATVEYTLSEIYYLAGRGHEQSYRARYYASLGYKYQKYSFECSNVLQWYPSLPAIPGDFFANLGLKYEAEYQLPYIMLGIDIQGADKGSGGLSVGYIPVVNFKDEDQHLLRDKVNVSDHGWGGQGWIIKAAGRYVLSDHWYLDGDLSWMTAESSGVSKASFGGVYDHSIEQKIENTQIGLFINLGYSF